MVKAQEYLDTNYPKEERKVLSEISLRNLNLKGDLNLEGFSYGLKVYLAGNPRLGQIKNKPLLTSFVYQNPQEYLNHRYSPKNKVKEIDLNFLDFDQAGELLIDNYPDLKRIIGRNTSNITKVTISNCLQLEKINIGGFINVHELILSNLPNLIYLDCPYNKIKNLDLDEFYNLQEVYCQNNYLTEIKLPNLGEKLEVLWLSDNNFSKDLSFLSHLVNLKHLDLRNNHFRGSLEFLKGMNKLEELNISNTDIDNGLEYLLDSIEDFSCSADKRKDAKVKVIEEIYQHLNYNPKKIKEFVNSSAQQWLDQSYPKNGVCQRETEDKGWDKTYGWNNKQKTRAEISCLDISSQELRGWLRLKGFTNLKKLNCSSNQLVYLDLVDSPNLIELKCDNNEFRKSDFLKPLNKLEKLWIQNNSRISNKNLSFFIPFKELRELDISDCSFGGSLKPLENLNKLERIIISHANISEGLESLPENCKELYCELDYNSKTMEIIKELGKSTKKGDTNWYNLDKWRIDKANNQTASIIPLERLFVIRGNLKQFLRKWGKNDEIQELGMKLNALKEKKDENSQDKIKELETKIEKIKKKLISDENGWKEIEVGKLQTPKEYSKYRYSGGIKWIARAAAVTGGILAITNDPIIGGSLAAASPFIDAIASHFEENYYNKNETSWKEFLIDVDTFLDNYHELLGIIRKISSHSKLGKVNKNLKNLEVKIEEFLKIYDVDENDEIDANELVSKRQELAQDLVGEEEDKIINENEQERKVSKLKTMVEAIKQLEDIVVAYKRDGSLIEEERLQNESLIMQNEQDWKNLGFTSQQIQEWADAFGQQFNYQDYKFVNWIKNEKSKDLENFTNPQWIKAKISTKELDLDELRREYQEELRQKDEAIDVVVDVVSEVSNSQQELIQQDAQIELANLTPILSNK